MRRSWGVKAMTTPASFVGGEAKAVGHATER